jgi:hypothetical protein
MLLESFKREIKRIHDKKKKEKRKRKRKLYNFYSMVWMEHGISSLNLNIYPTTPEYEIMCFSLI